MTIPEVVKEWLFAVYADAPCFLNRWQTLIAGLLALLGAWLTVRRMGAQIRQATELENARRIREEHAAKAVLPIALSELGQYARDCIKLLVMYVPGTGVGAEVTSELSAPRIPDGVIGPLQTLARYADPSIGNRITILLSKLQIQHGRLRGLILRTLEAMPESMSVSEGEDAIIDAADLYAYAGSFFEYARDTEGARKLCSPQELKRALRDSGIWDGMHDKVYARIDQRAAQEPDGDV